MGILDIKAVIHAFREGNLEEALDDYDVNDLAILKKEIEGYSRKQIRQEDLEDLLATIDSALQEKMAQP